MLKRLPINDNNGICFAVYKSGNFNGNLVSKLGNFTKACVKK